MDLFLEELNGTSDKEWLQKNLAAFLQVIDTHGRAAAYHHDRLVNKFIQKPAALLPEEGLINITASGPPLPALINSLEKLRDLRLAADRDDIPSRYKDIQKLKAVLCRSQKSRQI